MRDMNLLKYDTATIEAVLEVDDAAYIDENGETVETLVYNMLIIYDRRTKFIGVCDFDILCNIEDSCEYTFNECWEQYDSIFDAVKGMAKALRGILGFKSFIEFNVNYLKSRMYTEAYPDHLDYDKILQSIDEDKEDYNNGLGV